MFELEKDPAARGLGISLSGNKDGSRARMSVYVADIDPRGPAGLDGRICVGDEILEVRGRVSGDSEGESLWRKKQMGGFFFRGQEGSESKRETKLRAAEGEQ